MTDQTPAVADTTHAITPAYAPTESATVAKLAMALSAAQAAMKPPVKDSTNPHLKNKYADMASVIEASRDPLSKNHLAVTQVLHHKGGTGALLITKLIHESGEWIASEYPLVLTQNHQQNGSAITYARRYSLMAILGVAPDDDDDGNAASQKRDTNQRRDTTERKPEERKTESKPKDEAQKESAKKEESLPTPAADGSVVFMPQKGADGKLGWAVWGKWLLSAIDACTTIEAVNKLIEAHNQPINFVREKMAASFKTLDDAANRKRGDLSQAPGSLSQELDDEIPF